MVFIKFLSLLIQVTNNDVLQIEKKLLQNLEKILVKKRKIAVAERELLNREGSETEENWWGRLKAATSVLKPTRNKGLLILKRII